VWCLFDNFWPFEMTCDMKGWMLLCQLVIRNVKILQQAATIQQWQQH